MKQQKLNFFTPAKKRTIIDTEIQANNNKKQKITDSKQQENNNDKNENRTSSSSRPRRSCNKENLEVEADKERLDIGSGTKEEEKDGKKKEPSDNTNLKSNFNRGGKKENTTEGKKEVKSSKQTDHKAKSEIFNWKKKGKEDKEETTAKLKTSTKSGMVKSLEKEDKEEKEEGEDEKLDGEEEKNFSNSMKDAVKTECRICG